MPQNANEFAPIDFRTRFPALDGLRALAVLLVFFEHFGGGAHSGRVLNVLNQIRLRGWVGVDLFFVLSGFLITGVLYDTQADSHFFERFFARRALRILPVFYLVVAVLLLLTPAMQYEWRPGHLLFLVYLGNFAANHDFSLYEVFSRNHPASKVFLGHLWSLCVEEQFYVLWPLAVWAVRARVKLLLLAAGLCALAPVLRGVLLVSLGAVRAETWIVRTLPFRMDALLVGACLALLLRGPNAARWQRLCPALLGFAGACALAIFVFSPAYDSGWLMTVGLSFTALASAGLIGWTLRVDSAAYRLFYRKPLLVLGRCSYGFYLFHVLFRAFWVQVLIVLDRRFHSNAIAGLLSLGLNLLVTFAAAKLSYDWFESRFLRWKTRFEYDSERTGQHHAFVTR